ncbi:MAG: ANTAR domain-containing protein [Clostridia bacterium]|nr:ANTAR domain-containing protein [Clostridia bacterium]
MARIVIAGASEASRAQLFRLLASSGYPVFRCCASGGELRRALADCEDGVVILAGGLPDGGPDDFVADYGDRAQFLLIAKPAVLDRCEAGEVFRLALPTSAQAILGAVEMLSQLHRMRMPKRAGVERELVERAKHIWMRQKGMTEPEAHRAIQQYAMNHGVKMADCAARIIASEEQKGE